MKTAARDIRRRECALIAPEAAVAVNCSRGDDKEDIVRVAKRIGTFATSIEPHDDCCSLFIPKHPATGAAAWQLDLEEKKYDVEALVADALAKTETLRVNARQTETVPA